MKWAHRWFSSQGLVINDKREVTIRIKQKQAAILSIYNCYVNVTLTQIVIHEGPDGKLEKQGRKFGFNLFSIPSTQFKRSTEVSRHTFVFKVPQEPTGVA